MESVISRETAIVGCKTKNAARSALTHNYIGHALFLANHNIESTRMELDAEQNTGCNVFQEGTLVIYDTTFYKHDIRSINFELKLIIMNDAAEQVFC